VVVVEGVQGVLTNPVPVEVLLVEAPLVEDELEDADEELDEEAA